MNDGSIKIQIGASVDRSIEQAFGSIEKRAQKAGQNINKAFNNAMGAGSNGGGIGKGFDATSRAAAKAEKDIEREIAKQVKATAAGEKEMKREHEKAARDYIRTENEKWREIIRGIKEVEREQTKANRKAQQEEAQTSRRAERFASRVSQRSVRFLVPNPIGAFGMAHRIGGDILRGAGVDFSMSGMAQRAVGAQSLATQLSNQGFMRNEVGPNSHRVASDTLESEARANAQTSGFTTEQTLRAQTKFVDLTGNLNDARQAMPSILKLSGATGTDPEKMAEAWANVSRHMGDIPNKAAKVEGLMRLIAGQGRVGSIEIKDEAKDLGKIAAMADKYGGDRAASIGKLATLAQLGKAEGGAASSAQAATSVVSFTNTFSLAARLKAMFGVGLHESDIFNMTGSGKGAVRSSIKDPFEIIKKVLDKTGGDITKFGNVFKSVMSQRATNSLVAAYNSGGGHNMSAVDAKLAEFGSEAALSKTDVDEAQSARLKTTAAQATIFQEKLDEVGKSVEAGLLPALNDLAPKALAVAGALGGIVTWAANNPMTAVAAAIGLAIARAGIETAFRAGVEKAFTAAAGSGGGIALSGTVMMAAAAVTLINEDVREREEKQRKDAIDNGKAGELENEAQAGLRTGVVSQKSQADLNAINANLESRIAGVAEIKTRDAIANGGRPGGPSAATLAVEAVAFPERTAQRNDASHLKELQEELANNKRILDMIRTGVLRVEVTNPKEIGMGDGPKVYAPGRGPDPNRPPGPWRN